MNKKEIKKQVSMEFKADCEKKKLRKAEYKKMTDEQKAIAKTKYKEEKSRMKSAKKARKKEIKSLTGEEKKVAKFHDKYYKKIKTRPRRYAICGVVGSLILFGGIKISPMIADAIELLKPRDIVQGTKEAIEARDKGELLARVITDEGIVLLKNSNNLLPLTNKNVNVFGTQALDMRLSGGGSGAADVSRAVNLLDALDNAGIEYNRKLVNKTKEAKELIEESKQSDKTDGNAVTEVLSAMFMPKANDEIPIDYLTEEVILEAQSFSDNAIIVLTSDSVEASDATEELLQVKGNKLDLIETVSNNFENVIIIVNAGNTLELGFVEKYPSIKSVLYCGTPGATGPTSLAKIISGEVNPSGRLTDTLVYSNRSAPATENFGDYKYDNIDKMATLEYEEGIYVGYRYYETRYKDNEEKYQETVLYPFGYGLSYTEFEWEQIEYIVNDDTISYKIKVTNTGDVPGKDVVQVYYQPPYIEGGIEKTATALVDYAKTKLLQPDESEVLTIEFPIRHMTSWDMDKGYYVLEEGSYGITVNKNVHEPIITQSFILDKDIEYTESLTGYPYENQFEYAHGDLTYLSRNDWEGTYPTADDISTQASEKLLLAYEKYKNPEPIKDGEVILNVDSGIMLEDLKDLDYNDPKWESFLNQFTFKELNEFYTNGGWKTIEIERLGIPASNLLDGPAGINYFFGDVESAAYPTALLLAQTWNDELVYSMGEAMGEEANIYGVEGIYAPAMNIHRTAFGGRNFEYYSEDPVISGRMGTAIIEGIQSKDVTVTMKHFIMNDQEVNARSGLFQWANEQAIREIYLKPFELAEEETDVTGVMSSFIHLGPIWNGANPNLLNEVLRGELGFRGFVSSDAVFWFMDPTLAMRNGGDIHLAAFPSSQEKIVKEAYKKDPIGIVTGLKTSVHNVLYTLLNESKIME